MSIAQLDFPQATLMLRQSPLPALRGLDVVESETEVVIRGSVGSYYEKQLAQEAVRAALGDRRLVNQVRVDRN